MVQTDPQTEKSAKASAPIFPPMEFVEISRQRLAATITVQTELFDRVRELNQAWLARAQSEVHLTSELTNKLIAARSLPDATAAWQEWANMRMSLLAEDSRRFGADCQNSVETVARRCDNGWSGGGGTRQQEEAVT